MAHTGVKESTLSSYAMNDGKRLSAIREKGADITSRRAERVMNWFSENWPIDLQWPKDVERPTSSNQKGAA
jgi:hypothetical protein